MTNTAQATEERFAAIPREMEDSKVSHPIAAAGMGFTTLISAGAGIWGMGCLISGLIRCSGFHEVGKVIITAITGS